MEIARLEDHRPFVAADGSTVWEPAGIPSGNAAHQSPAEATVQPETKALDRHHVVSEGIALLAADKGRMRLGDDERDVRAGDCVVMVPGTPYRLGNGGSEPLALLSGCAPADADTVLRGD